MRKEEQTRRSCNLCTTNGLKGCAIDVLDMKYRPTYVYKLLAEFK